MAYPTGDGEGEQAIQHCRARRAVVELAQHLTPRPRATFSR